MVFIRFPAPPADWVERAARGADALQRSPLLERLLARADALSDADWRGSAFRVLAQGSDAVPAVGAAALLAAQGAEAAAGAGGCAQTAFVASALHCVATMTSVHLPPGGVLQLAPAEAAELAADFERRFAGAQERLIAAPDGSLCCLIDRAVAASGVDPAAIAGSDIHDFLPAGPDGPQLRRFMSEIEMWLFEHPLNLRRAAAGALPITGLWLWGGGPPIAGLPALRGSIAGTDPLFAAWPALAAPAGAGRGRAGGAAVVVVADLPGTPAWSGAERQWILPSLEALRSGGLEELDLSAGGRRFRLTSGRLWRWWRRARPWWEYFA
jgi:hypothetical protein